LDHETELFFLVIDHPLWIVKKERLMSIEIKKEVFYS